MTLIQAACLPACLPLMMPMSFDNAPRPRPIGGRAGGVFTRQICRAAFISVGSSIFGKLSPVGRFGAAGSGPERRNGERRPS